MISNKSMKKIGLSFLVIMIVSLSFSCKKEKSPDLEVTVVDNDNIAVPRVWVKTSVEGASAGILNAQVIDSARTDAFGKAYFEYKNTVLIDIAIYSKTNRNQIVDSTSVLLETKRVGRKSDNVTEKKLVFR